MPWVKGVSGNPSGRKKDAFITKARNRIQRRIPAILDKLAELAEQGDVQAARLLLERTVPTIKPDYSDLELRLTTLEAGNEGQ